MEQIVNVDKLDQFDPSVRYEIKQRYGTRLIPIPVGFAITAFRTPQEGDWFIATDKGIPLQKIKDSICGPRLILWETLQCTLKPSDVYSNLPETLQKIKHEGYEIINFRLPKLNDIIYDHADSIIISSFNWTSPCFILQFKPKKYYAKVPLVEAPSDEKCVKVASRHGNVELRFIAPVEIVKE